MGTQLASPKRGAEPPIFGPCLLWPNIWIDQDATWYGDKPWPKRRCVRWCRSSPWKGHSPQFSVHVYCGQMAGWMKMLLGTEVDLGPGHIVLDLAPLRKGHSSPPSFRPMSIVATVHLRYCWALVERIAETTLDICCVAYTILWINFKVIGANWD